MSPAYDKRQLLKSAYNYAQGGQWDRALDEYRRITKLFPDDPNVHSMVADLLVKKNDPAGASASHLEAARLFKDAGNDDKELIALKKSLKVQSGNAEAASRLESYFMRNIARASQLISVGNLKDAETLASKLLDADPAHLGVNRLLDEIKSLGMQAQAVMAMQEEERLAVANAPVADTTRDVLARLSETADAYMRAEDFDNAIETMLIMMKIDPSRIEIRGQLEQAQEQLKKKQQAQAVWQNMMAKDNSSLDEVKEREVSAKEMAEWASQEAAVRERLARELEAAEAAAREELEVIERAVQEIRGRSGSAPSAPASLAAGNETKPDASISGADETRLRALEIEKRQLEERLQQERDEAIEREKAMQEQVRRESELLKHAIEMEKLEVEAKAKAEALKALEAKLEAERREQARQLEEERNRSQAAEAALRSQMQELMREEMAKLRDEMRSAAVADVQIKLDNERQHREAMEAELKAKESEAVARYRAEQSAIEESKRQAEQRARAEREAIETLKVQDEARKQALVEEALKRRNMRSGSGTAEDKKRVMQSSRRISDVLHAATTKHLEQDVEGMLETARRYLQQDLLLDAMRICQKIATTDPQNEKVKALLKEIYVKKGL